MTGQLGEHRQADSRELTTNLPVQSRKSCKDNSRNDIDVAKNTSRNWTLNMSCAHLQIWLELRLHCRLG